MLHMAFLCNLLLYNVWCNLFHFFVKKKITLLIVDIAKTYTKTNVSNIIHLALQS